ncbi:MAG: alpha/beta hydrolase [Candidatus Obscuribacterales bacterium]|nr:alpha/beta hydrolase [Candidatus Obscuribacterales bacterium]
MYISYIAFIICVLALCCFFSTKKQPSKPPMVYRDIIYAEKSASREQQCFDLPVPQSTRAVPLIVYIHGGGWVVGDKTMNPAVWIWKRGSAVASINYRLAPMAKFPAQLDDCIYALKYLQSHAREYNRDPNRIGIFGISSGAHLAALAALSDDLFDEKDKPRGRAHCLVKAVCVWCGIYDFLTKTSDL